MGAKEQIQKTEENLKSLFDILKVAQKERDEARDQLQKLLNNIMPFGPLNIPNIQPEGPLLLPAKANSSITESNSLSETYNHQSNGSSPVGSFLDADSSPELSNINVVDSTNICFAKQQSFMHKDYSGSVPTTVTKTDHASAVIETIAKSKVLPQKGKLLQTVMDAGPLLQTLLVAGPLPRWRNPPPMQAFQIPPCFVKGYESSTNNKQEANNCYMSAKSLNSLVCPEMSRGFPQTCSSSLLSFAGNPSNSSLNTTSLLASTSSLNSQIPVAKRQRLQ